MKYKAATTISIAAMVAIAFVACSADVEVALDETVTTEAEAPVEEQVDETVDAGESENDAEVETTTTTEEMVDSTIGESEPAEDADDEAPSTTIPPTTTTTEPPAEEDIVEELELIEILGVRVGAGSGEYVVVVGNRPEGLERFKLSLSSADGYCTPEQFNNQGYDNGDGSYSIDWFSDTCGDRTIGVSWVHEDGRRSGISYHTCDDVVSLTGELC